MFADRLMDMQKQLARSKKATDDVLRWSTMTPKRTSLLEDEAAVLTSQLSKTKKAHDGAASGSVDRSREVRTLEARMRMPCDELALLKCRESANCDLEVIACELVDGQDDITKLATGLQQSNVSSFNSIRRNVNNALVAVSKRLKEAFRLEARDLQQGVLEAVRATARSTWDPFAGAPGAVNKSLGLIIGRASSKSKSANPGAFSSRTANWDAYDDTCRSRTWSADVPPSASMPG